MKTVKITSGKYGYHPNGSKAVRVIHAGEMVDLADEEAARLVDLGVAVIMDSVGTMIEEPAEEPAVDTDDLYTMTNAQLRDMATGMGIDVSKARTKTMLIDAILSSDGDTLPKMDAEEPVT